MDGQKTMVTRMILKVMLSVFITKDGIYDLTFTFNSKTHEVSCDATRKADAIIERYGLLPEAKDYLRQRGRAVHS